jgi:hypothetical protein
MKQRSTVLVSHFGLLAIPLFFCFSACNLVMANSAENSMYLVGMRETACSSLSAIQLREQILSYSSVLDVEFLSACRAAVLLRNPQLFLTAAVDSDLIEHVERFEPLWKISHAASLLDESSAVRVNLMHGVVIIMMKHQLSSAILERALRIERVSKECSSETSPESVGRSLLAVTSNSTVTKSDNGSPFPCDGICLYAFYGGLALVGVLLIGIFIAVVCRKRRKQRDAVQMIHDAGSMEAQDYQRIHSPMANYRPTANPGSRRSSVVHRGQKSVDLDEIADISEPRRHVPSLQLPASRVRSSSTIPSAGRPPVHLYADASATHHHQHHPSAAVEGSHIPYAVPFSRRPSANPYTSTPVVATPHNNNRGSRTDSMGSYATPSHVRVGSMSSSTTPTNNYSYAASTPIEPVPHTRARSNSRVSGPGFLNAQMAWQDDLSRYEDSAVVSAARPRRASTYSRPHSNFNNVG